MTHSYLSIHQLIEQIDSGETTRPEKQTMPDWLQTFIGNVAEHFDPIGGTARAGYVAAEDDGRWTVRLFLGETEVVGGARDGAVIPTAFAFDLSALQREFASVERFEWHGFPAGSIPQQLRDDATIAIDGHVSGGADRSENVRLLINLRAPEEMTPGIKQDAEGNIRPA